MRMPLDLSSHVKRLPSSMVRPLERTERRLVIRVLIHTSSRMKRQRQSWSRNGGHRKKRSHNTLNRMQECGHALGLPTSVTSTQGTFMHTFRATTSPWSTLARRSIMQKIRGLRSVWDAIASTSMMTVCPRSLSFKITRSRDWAATTWSNFTCSTSMPSIWMERPLHGLSFQCNYLLEWSCSSPIRPTISGSMMACSHILTSSHSNPTCQTWRPKLTGSVTIQRRPNLYQKMHNCLPDTIWILKWSPKSLRNSLMSIIICIAKECQMTCSRMRDTQAMMMTYDEWYTRAEIFGYLTHIFWSIYYWHVLVIIVIG